MSGERVRVFGPAVLLLLAAGCAGTAPRAVFQPKDTAGVESFLRNGAAIGAIHGDSVFALAQVEPVNVAGLPYARLWLLVSNQSSKPFLVEPLKCASLHIESIRGKDPYVHQLDLTPASATSILKTITNEQATSWIFTSIGAALEASAAQPTTARSAGRSSDGSSYTSTTTVNDVAESRRRITERRMAEAAATDDWYESFKGSVNQGILRRNTLFPGEGANGYIYFRISGTQPKQLDRRYVVTLALPEGEKVAMFEPIAGE